MNRKAALLSPVGATASTMSSKVVAVMDPRELGSSDGKDRVP